MKVIKKKLNPIHSYILLNIETLKIGETTLFDIYIKKQNDYVIIIESGTLLNEVLYAKLKKHDELYILREDEAKGILSCESLKYYIRQNRDDPKKRIKILYEVNDQLFDIFITNKENKIHYECVKLIVESIIYLIKYDKDFIRNTMPYFVNDYMLKDHSLHVAVYALALGNALEYKHEELVKLGTAGLLHDIGIKEIDKNILNKSEKITSDELKKIQKHSLRGVEILQQNKIHDPYILNAVLHHHERLDGSGYPNQLTKEKITPFASILAICDVFDALTNNRPHRKEYRSFDALRMMMRDTDMVNGLHQKYLHTSIKLL